MSTTVDERVVSMQFDNKHFEKNVETSMSTLDKLEKKLNLKGASKGLESVGAASRKMAKESEYAAYQTGFHWTDVGKKIASVWEYDIANRIQASAKKIMRAFTIDPFKTGFSEYETQINAVQTILANTESKGTTIDQVNQALEELNKYADQTIYNFTEMTRNIGTFTAAGVELDTSVSAIKGIANLAAVSGSTSQQASTAMYQLSQALSSGTVKLMDWNSVVNAGMGGQVFQDALKETARVHGVAIDSMIDKEGSFRETLSNGWLTSEILTETLEKFTMTTEGLTEAEIEANREKLRSIGYTEEQIEGIFKLGNTATNAATKVKTFTQLWDVLKEAAQSGWAQTWKIIIGDYAEAKEMLSPLAEVLTGIINKMSDARNNFLEMVMDSPFGKLYDRINKITGTVKDAVDAAEKLDEVVDKVISGDYGNGKTRWGRLSEEGYDWAKVQNLVNEELGSSVRHEEQLKDAQDKANESQATTIEQLIEMSDAQLKSIGFTEEEIKSLRELSSIAEKTGYSLAEVIKNPDLISGRNLLIASFKNIGNYIGQVAGTVKEAWNDIFPPNAEGRAKTIYNLIASFKKFTDSLTVNEEKADKLRRTFKGLFAIIDIVATITGGLFKTAFKIVSTVLEMFNLDILDVTAALGDGIVAIRDWIKAHDPIVKIVKWVVEWIAKGIDSFKAWATSVGDAKDIPKAIIEGFINGVKSFGKGVIDAAKDLVTKFVDKVKNMLGIHSPSVEFYEIGKNVIQGFVNGLKWGLDVIWEAISYIYGWIKSKFDMINWEGLEEKGKSLVESFGNGIIDGFTWIGNQLSKAFEWLKAQLEGVDWGSVAALVSSIGLVLVGLSISQTSSALSGFIGTLSDLAEGFGKVLKKFKKTLTGLNWWIKAQAFMTIAKAIAILAASIAILAFIPAGKLWSAIGAVAVLTILIGVVLGVLAFISKNEGQIIKGSFALWSFGAAIVLLSASLFIIHRLVKQIDAMENPVAAYVKLGVILALLMSFMIGIAIITKKAYGYAGSIGACLIWMSVSMLMLTGVMAIIGNMDPGTVIQGMIVIALLMSFFAGLIVAVSFIKDKVEGLAKVFINLGFGLLAMTGALAILGTLPMDVLIQGFITIALLMGLITALVIFVTKFSGSKSDLKSLGNMFIGLGIGLLAMSAGIAILTKLDQGKMWSAIGAISALMGAIFVLSYFMSDKKGQFDKLGKSFIMLGAALLAITVAIVILTFLNPGKMWSAVIALSVLIGGVAAVVKMANGINKNAVGTLAVIGVLITLIAGFVIAFTYMPQEQIFTAILLMGGILALFVAFFKCIVNINTSAKNLKKSFATLILLGAIITTLGLLVIGLSFINAENALVAVAAVVVLLGAMLGALKFLELINGKVFVGILALAAVEVLVFGLAIIMLMLSKLDPGQALQMVGVISLFLGAMLVAAGILALFSTIGVYALIGAAYLAAIIVIIGGALAVAGALVAGSLALLGLSLGLFAESSKSFIETMRTIDGSVLSGTAIIVAAIILLSLLAAVAAPAITGAATVGAIAIILSGCLAIAAELAGGALVSFGQDLSSFATEVQTFIDVMRNVDETVLNGVSTLAAAVAIITGTSFINGVVNFVKKLFGGGSKDNKFTKVLKEFGDGVVAFSDKVSGNVDVATFSAVGSALNGLVKFQDLDVKKFETAVEALDSLNIMVNKMSKVDYTGIKVISDVLPPINKFAAIDVGNLSAAIKEVNKLKELMVGLGTVDVSGVNSFETALEKVADKGVTAFTDTFDNSTEEVSESVNGMVSTAADSTKDSYKEYKGAGSYLVSGFIAGISARISAAAAMAAAMAKAALMAAKAALNINSPSKEFYDIGAYSGEGFVIALDDYSDKSYDAGATVADYARRGLSDAIAKVTDVINSDVDSQPTIRPVIDLSDVESGANAINKLLSMNPALGVSSNINSVSKMMSKRQNGVTTEDLLSAISSLERLGEKTGNTYTINGITYDDGSNIAAAIELITREALRQRRS
jgi:tape measure domain-containing protein